MKHSQSNFIKKIANTNEKENTIKKKISKRLNYYWLTPNNSSSSSIDIIDELLQYTGTGSGSASSSGEDCLAVSAAGRPAISLFMISSAELWLGPPLSKLF